MRNDEGIDARKVATMVDLKSYNTVFDFFVPVCKIRVIEDSLSLKEYLSLGNSGQQAH